MSLDNKMEVSVLNRNISNTSMMSSAVKPDVLISDEAANVFSWINFLVCEIIAIFGTAANILNIICFAKPDLKDAINVSFLSTTFTNSSIIGLAISDLGSVVMLLWSCVCMIPGFRDADVPFDPVALQSLVTGYPHIIFTRPTGWITGLITVERCLCITMPLKVKNILTSNRVTTIIVCIFIIITGGVSPTYYSSTFAWTFVAERNRTILALVYTDDRFTVEQVSHGITNIFIPATAYVTVITSTIILVIKLRAKTNWRLKCTSKKGAHTLSLRDQKVAKMVVMISSLFIACFIPLCFLFAFMVLEPRISVGGQYQNTLTVFGGIAVFLEGTNSSLNAFIYYHMSSKYRAVFQKLFGRGRIHLAQH